MKTWAQEQEQQNFNHKKSYNRNTHNFNILQPWMDEPETIPLYLLKTQSEISHKDKQKKTKLRHYGSLEIIPKNYQTSPKKQSRKLEHLIPRMNIDSRSLSRKVSVGKSKELQNSPKKRKGSSPTLPTVTISRQLAIERKLFLLSHKQENSSPVRKKVQYLLNERSQK